MKCLDGMTLAEQVEHLTYMVEELTTPPPEFADCLTMLSFSQRRMVGLMMKRRGEVVPFAALWAAGEISEDCNSDNILRSHISQARRKLRDAGVPLEIHNEWGIGYRAVLV